MKKCCGICGSHKRKLQPREGNPGLFKSILGQTEEVAMTLIREAGYSYRVMEKDGQKHIETTDVRSDRVNLAITEGKVTKAWIG